MRYCMCMLSHRLQILLEEDQYRQLSREADRCGSSVAAVIRDAIDHRLHDDLGRRKAAIDAILAAEPMEVPEDPQDIRRELDDAHDRMPWS